MKWEEIKNIRHINIPDTYEATDIECPHCGEKLYRRTGVVLASYPAQYGYKCKKCGFYGTA